MEKGIISRGSVKRRSSLRLNTIIIIDHYHLLVSHILDVKIQKTTGKNYTDTEKHASLLTSSISIESAIMRIIHRGYLNATKIGQTGE